MATMSGLPDDVRDELEAALAVRVEGATPLSGGDINHAVRVALTDGTAVFVKHHAAPPVGSFAVEAAGLDWIRVEGGPPVPRVRAVGRRFLALDLVEGRGAPEEEAFGRRLAALHRASADTFGWDRDGHIGTLPQSNTAASDWATFYREQRLRPQVRRVQSRGLLDSASRRTLDRVLGRVETRVGPDAPPSRLHGDLWGGNRIADGAGRSWLVDPAPYAGHREVDLAMMRLFGGFSERCFNAYAEAFPLSPGWRDRVDLYQLYYLLVHVNLFGAGWLGQAMAAAARLA
jgi:fructosamine-3-kinase